MHEKTLHSMALREKRNARRREAARSDYRLKNIYLKKFPNGTLEDFEKWEKRTFNNTIDSTIVHTPPDPSDSS